MPSRSKPNMIGNLRGKYDPHFKLEGRVDRLEKDTPFELSQIHKTLSKSFGMQRKTLVRVLGLEEKVAELELEKEVLEEVVDEIEEEINEIDEEVPEELDDLLEDIRQGDEPTKTGTKPKVEVVPTKKKKKKKKPIKPIGKKIPKKKPVAKKKKISAKDLKKGTIGERIERLEQNAKDTAAADTHRGTAEFTEISTGTDPATGEPLSPEERKRRFKLRKRGISPEAFKTGSSVGGAQRATKADTTGASDLVEVGKAPDASAGITPEGEEETSAGGGGNKKRDEGILKGLKAINSSIDGIIRALTDGTKEDKKAADTARKETEKRKRKGAESALEKIGGVALKGIQSVLKPAMGIFQRIWEFIKTVFLGRIVMLFFDWMSKNQGKLASMFKFIKDWWPVMVAGILAIFGPILGPVGWVVGVGALVWWGFNRIQAVIKFITDIFKNVFDFLTLGLFKGKDDPKKVGDSVLKDTESEFQGGDLQDRMIVDLNPHQVMPLNKWRVVKRQ